MLYQIGVKKTVKLLPNSVHMFCFDKLTVKHHNKKHFKFSCCGGSASLIKFNNILAVVVLLLYYLKCTLKLTTYDQHIYIDIIITL